MFKLNLDLLEKIKKAITPAKLVPAEGMYTFDCFGCSSECSSGCKGSCMGSCYGGCFGSCSGHSR